MYWTTFLLNSPFPSDRTSKNVIEHASEVTNTIPPGTATCIAISPERDDILLLGVDTGALFQVCTSNTNHSIIRYPAHLGPVTAVTWNNIHKKVFASCAFDWNIKIWLQHHL